MSKKLWGTTFQAGEFEKLQRELWPQKPPVSRDAAAKSLTPSRGLFHSHFCTVHYYDGKVGECHYLRQGPRWHTFLYLYPPMQGEKNEAFSTLHHTSLLENDRMIVEQMAQTNAYDAYRKAMDAERQYYFCRASADPNARPPRQPDPRRFTTDAKTAKAWSGKYALCRTGLPELRLYGNPVSDHLVSDDLPDNFLFDDPQRLNEAWLQKTFTDEFGKEGSALEIGLVVACFNRLDRCWELPRFNLLYHDCDLRDIFAHYLPLRYRKDLKTHAPL